MHVIHRSGSSSPTNWANRCKSTKNSSTVSPEQRCVTNWLNVLNLSVAYAVMRACFICSASALCSLLSLLYTARVTMGEWARFCPWRRPTIHSQSIQQWAYQSLCHWILGLAGHWRPCHPLYICQNNLKNEERKKKKSPKSNIATPKREAICDWNWVTHWTLLRTTLYPIVFRIIHRRHCLQ